VAKVRVGYCSIPCASSPTDALRQSRLDRAGQCCARQKISSTTIHAGYFLLFIGYVDLTGEFNPKVEPAQ
jgi:hypothetical protein